VLRLASPTFCPLLGFAERSLRTSFLPARRTRNRSFCTRLFSPGLRLRNQLSRLLSTTLLSGFSWAVLLGFWLGRLAAVGRWDFGLKPPSPRVTSLWSALGCRRLFAWLRWVLIRASLLPWLL
jgi:hypothetical protein